MNRVIASILQNDRGAAVRNLQDALLRLLSAGDSTLSAADRDALESAVGAERREDRYGDATTRAVAQFQRDHRAAFDLPLVTGEQVDDATAVAMNRMLEQLGTFEPARTDAFLITGRVEFEDGTPAPRLRVDAFDRELGIRRALLGDSERPSVTGDDGVFPTIRYRAADVTGGEGRSGPNADIVFEVTGAADASPRTIASLHRRRAFNGTQSESEVPDPVLGFEATSVEDVRIVLVGRPGEDGLSEYRRLLRELQPLLLDRVTPAVFDQEHSRDVDFAARETGWDRALVETMVLAWQLAREALRDAPPRPELFERLPIVLPETFYGLLRGGSPTEVAPLSSTLSELLDQDTRWKSKLEDSLEHRIIDGELREHLDRLRDLRTDRVARPGDGRTASIGDVLMTAGIAEQERRTLLSAYQAHDGTVEAFWRDVVPQQVGLNAEAIRSAQSALHLADVLSYDLPLMTRLRQRNVATARDLVAIDRRELADLVSQVGPLPDAPGATVEEQVARTVDSITAIVDATYPTETMAHLASISQDRSLGAARDLLARFFERETATDGREGFDLRTTPVTTYLEAHGDRVFGDLQPDDRALLTSQLQRLQRVFRLGVDRAQTESLLTLGLDSAFHITRFSPEHFVAEFGDRLGGADKAALTYGRAERIAGTIVYVYADLWEGVHGVKPMSIMSASGPEKIPELKQLPAYRALFGNTQLCDCGHCQSLYSPAAYFIDLLHMLDQPSPGAAKPVDVLLKRRPDLAHIQLTCENTNTLIPYVDLVTEVLESFVANRAPTPFNVPPAPPNQKLPTPSAEELRVNPVYLTTASSTFADQAYAALQDAVFPLTLPLNLSLETTRVYLDHLGVDRADLMALFDGDTGLEALMARAAEVLRLSPEEFGLITGAKFSGASSLRPSTAAELFGLSTAAPATAFNHAAPEFVVNAAAPDQRTALISALQNILGILSPTPPPITGRYDAATAAAVNAVLVQHALSANGRTDDAFWGAMEGDGMPSLSAIVCPVPMFLDRSGLTYEELVALVKTRFLNPDLQGEGDADYLARLGIPGADVRAWIQAGLPAMPAPIQTVLTKAGEDPVAFTAWVRRRTRAVVINMGFAAPCDLERATLMHLDGTLLSPDELVTLFRFIRLWRKLGWSITELDHALEPGSLQSSNVFQTILLLANIKQLHVQLDAPVAELVSLWGSIPTHGASSLYDRLFRNRAAQLVDPVLALDRDRTELDAATSATPPALSDHVGALVAALRLSTQDLARVRTTTGLDDDSSLPPASQPRLDLASLSAIYRRVWLARTLGLSVRELLALLDLSGLDVFERPDRFPRGQALAFADVVEKVRTSGVDVGTLDYLCRAIPQPTGLPSTQRGAWSRTLASLVDGLHAVTSEEPLRDDPDGEALTARLTALIGPDDARATTALLYGRDVYRTTLAGFPAALPLPAALTGRLTYDAARKELRLRGAMTAADRTLLLALPGVPAAIQAAYTRAVKTLADQPRAFVARALAPLFSAAEAEAVLIDVPSLGAAGTPVASVIDAKIADVLARQRSVASRGLIKQTLTTATGLAADGVGLLLENATVLTSVSGTGPAMNDYQAIDGDGLDAEYFANPDLTGPATVQRVDEGIGFDLQGAPPALGVPVTGFSVRWTGTLYVPATGEVAFHVRCTDGVRLTVNDSLVIDEWQDQSESEFNAAARLDGGQFYPIVIDYYNKTGDALLEVTWSSPSIPSAAIDTASLYTSARFESLVQRIERVHKIALLLSPFAISAHDLQRLAEHGDVTLDLMPVAGPAALSTGQAMFRQWLTLSDFATLRDRYPASGLSLMDVPNAGTREESLARFVTISGVVPETLEALVAALSDRVFDAVTSTWTTEEPDLTTLAAWRRIADALVLVQRTGAAPAQLLAWAKTREIAELPTGPETQWFTWTVRDESGTNRGPESAELAQTAKNLVRARYEESQWRVEARTLNDVLRIRRRSALTAFVLAMPEMMGAHVTDTGRLFEFLLIDVEMDPCMETSRIKQGISSVQLFVQRALLNLELLVPPSRIDRARWEWTRTYRVWEANRKVLFYAESYVQESLRDDKTPIFKEFESELLQDDLNEPNAERAVRHYLEKLDGIAKLIVCGSCIDSDAGALHVFARTATTPFVFYHRRLDSRTLSWTEGVWSPWQKLPVDVATIDDGDDSGAHLMPVVWNRRLYLFWPLFEQRPDKEQNAKLPDGFDQIDLWRVKLAWSEYKDGQWSPKQTGAPFLVSDAFRGERTTTSRAEPTHYTANLIHHPGRVVELRVAGVFVGFLEIEAPSDERVDTVIDQRPDNGLNGIVLKNSDWAQLVRTVETTTFVSLLPKPRDHYLDAEVSGSALTIRLLCRFRGFPKGQLRTVTEDAITVVHDGQRTDRKERTQIDSPATGDGVSVFEAIGTFHFPACTSEIVATQTGDRFDWASLSRPTNTVNTFMGMRFQAVGRIDKRLQLTADASPVLGSGTPFFNVIDSYNRSGFTRLVPFFYQDLERCYLVTRDLHDTHAQEGGSQSASVSPDRRGTTADRAFALTAVDERRVSVAPGATLRTNPWEQAALERWSAGPGVPVTLRSPATPTVGVPSTKLGAGHVFADTDASDVIHARANAQPEYTFTPHWHPYTCPFLSELASDGLTGLVTLENESLTDAQLIFTGVIGGPPMPILVANKFESAYKPDPMQVVRPYPKEEVDFSRNGAYARYNWELFFHAPMTLADAYCRAGRHEDALRCIHRVYDPMTADGDLDPSRVWRFIPFRAADTTRIEDSVELLGYTGSDPAKLKLRANLQATIQEWLDNPFNPHLIARHRPVVYKKYVFMKYLDCLIEWADTLFRRGTMESINEATQLYVLAANQLGPRLRQVPTPGPVAPETFATLRKRLDSLANAQVDLETRLPFTQLFGAGTGAVGQLTQLPQTLYFCLPQNEKLLAYWDTVADRLFKIRHCMSIDGIVRQLSLFDSPINPQLFVDAIAHGVDIGSVLDDLYAPLPRYRFTFMLQQALALCNEVRTLGNTLLSVFEKRDAERLFALRSGNESQLLDQLTANKKSQIDEAEQLRQALDVTLRMTTARYQYYDNLIAQGLIGEEKDQLASLGVSNEQQEMASWLDTAAHELNLVPNVTTGTSGGTTFGGSNLGSAASAVARGFSGLSASNAYKANRASITGGHARRAEEWRFQRDQAKRELDQIDRQLTAARIRLEIAQADLRNHETQIEHARSVEEHLRTKFTNQELYGWMEGEVRVLYFQCYKAAYEAAKAAQRAFRYSLGREEASFVTFGAWDSSVRGLLAGERLYMQLKQMERAYLDAQVREFEISKDVSVAQLDPLALIALKENGVCEVEVPEWLFDIDYAGHYFRRLKTVGMSIPAVVGRGTSLSATLTLLNSKLRTSSRIMGTYAADANFRPDHLAVEAIAVSDAQNESGRFQLDFHDEKYLPFEGAGAICRFRIELPRFRSWDYDTMSDVTLHLRLTSRRDDTLVKPALDALQAQLDAAGTGTLLHLMSLRHDFPNEWQTLHQAARAATVTITKDRLPLLVQGGTVTATELHAALILKDPRPAVTYKATITPGGGIPIDLQWPGAPGRYRSDMKLVTIPISSSAPVSGWHVQVTAPTLPADVDGIRDILIAFRYSVKM